MQSYLFYENFSTDLSDWTESYCDSWLANEEAHLRGNTSGYYGTLYHSFSSYFEPEYTIGAKLARVGSFTSEDHYYGLYTRVNDTGTITISYWWFVIEPSTSGENWVILGFLYNSSTFQGQWAKLDNNSSGNSSLIKTGINEWNNIFWTIEQDKTVIVYVGDQLFYQSDEITNIESQFGVTITMDLTRIGYRTVYNREVKIDDASLTKPLIASFALESESGFEGHDKDLKEKKTEYFPLPPKDISKLKTLREVMAEFLNK